MNSGISKALLLIASSFTDCVIASETSLARQIFHQGRAQLRPLSAGSCDVVKVILWL